MINKFYYLYIILTLVSCTNTKELDIKDNYRILILKLDGKSYDKLWLRTEYLTIEKPYSDGITPVNLALEIEGKSDDGYNWLFTVPDSIDQKRTEGYMIKKQPFDFKLNKEGILMFSLSDEDGISGIDLDKDTIVIEGAFLKTIINDKYKGNDDIAYVLTDTFALAPIFEYDIFKITSITKNTNIEIFLNFPVFAKLAKKNYEEELQKRIEYVKRYSESKYLLESFLWSEGYKNKKDMKLVFDNFSDSLKSSKEGKQMMEYLTEIVAPTALDTTQLINTKTKQSELIIKEPSKYTLVIFSASWCGPCHKQIPLLKRIYNDLGKKLNIVYISIDHKNDIDSWVKLMEKEDIPWRSLFADEKYKGLKEKYSIEGIPHSILIYPSGKEEKIDIRNNSEKKKLYNLVEAIK